MDTGPSGVFVWIGKGATRQERNDSMMRAEGYLTAKGLPDWTPITRVTEHSESVMFKAAFSKWQYEVPKSFLSPGASSSKYMYCLYETYSGITNVYFPLTTQIY